MIQENKILDEDLKSDNKSINSFIKDRVNTNKIFPYARHEERVNKLNDALNGDLLRKNVLQWEGVNTIFDHLMSESGQMYMFCTGEGGTGKSEIIKLTTEFARLYFGRQEGHYGPVLVVSQTGTASSNETCI